MATVNTPDCFIRKVGDYVLATVGAHLSADEVEECYRLVATHVLENNVPHLLIVGVGEEHPHSHLAARDALIAVAEIGVPTGFKVAFVPRTDATLNGYRHAEAEGVRRGLRAKVFQSEAAAVGWLTQPELH